MMSQGIYTCPIEIWVAYSFKGHPEYGCFISPDKTVTNFECDNATTLYQRQKGKVVLVGLLDSTKL
jgi:hypothetical protein